MRPKLFGRPPFLERLSNAAPFKRLSKYGDDVITMASRTPPHACARTQRKFCSSIRCPTRGRSEVSERHGNAGIIRDLHRGASKTAERCVQPPKSKFVARLGDFLYQRIAPRSIVVAYVFQKRGLRDASAGSGTQATPAASIVVCRNDLRFILPLA